MVLFRILVPFLNSTVCLYCSYSVGNGGYIGFKSAVPLPDLTPRTALCIFYEGRNRKLSNKMHVVIYQNVGCREYKRNKLPYCRQNLCNCRYWGCKGSSKHTDFLQFFVIWVNYLKISTLFLHRFVILRLINIICSFLSQQILIHDHWIVHKVIKRFFSM